MIRRGLALAAALLGVLALIAGHPKGTNLTRRNAGVLAGWPGVRPAAYPPDSGSLPGTAAARTRNVDGVSAEAANLEILRPRFAGLRMTNGAIRQPGNQISAVELAEWIRDRKPGLRVVDLRSEAAFEEYHLPRAERADSLASMQFNANETIVVVSGAAVADRNVYVLRGGVPAWIDEVMNPTITADATPAARAGYDRASIVSRYFGGVPRIVDKLPATRANAVAVRRRGC